MKLLIVEDEPPIAEDIKEICQSVLEDQIDNIQIAFTLTEAEEYLRDHSIDLCLLDLNLKGENGYDILKKTVSHPFHTIIVSAFTEQAIEAFNYGVLDFVPKPVDANRLKAAFNKFYDSKRSHGTGVKYLVVRKHNSNHIIPVDEIRYFEAQGYIVKIFLKDSKTELIDKPLNRLIQLLPENFIRIHRSYIAEIKDINSFRHKGGGVYEVELKKGEHLPLSPSAYKLLQQKADQK